MRQPLVSRPVVVSLVVAAVLLPIAICVVLSVSALLSAMGDAAGGGVLLRIALGCGLLWIVDLVGLVLVLAIHHLDGPASNRPADAARPLDPDDTP